MTYIKKKHCIFATVFLRLITKMNFIYWYNVLD